MLSSFQVHSILCLLPPTIPHTLETPGLELVILLRLRLHLLASELANLQMKCPDRIFFQEKLCT